MLTNAMETQMVHSLGVKIGPNGANGAGKEPATPMGTMRSSLRGYSDSSGAARSEDTEVRAVTGADSGAESIAASDTVSDASSDSAPASKCPFTGMVTEQMEKQSAAEGPIWTPEAEARMAQIPSFIRPMVQKGIEEHARSNKCPVIDDAVIDSVRNNMGM